MNRMDGIFFADFQCNEIKFHAKKLLTVYIRFEIIIASEENDNFWFL